MIHALKSIWAVLSALFLGAIGQPTGGTEPEASARKARQRSRMDQNSRPGALQTVGTLLRTVFYAVTFQPDNEPSRPSRRGRRK